jgi:hypothetical protein
VSKANALLYFVKPEPRRVLLYLLFLFIMLTAWFYILWQDSTASYILTVYQFLSNTSTSGNASNAEAKIILKILPLDQTSISMNVIIPRYPLYCFSLYDIYGCPISDSLIVQTVAGQVALYLAACAIVSSSEILLGRLTNRKTIANKSK